MSLTTQVRKIVKGMAEIKHKSQWFSYTNVYSNTSGANLFMYPFAMPSVGTSDSQRTGDEIRIKSLRVNFVLYNTSSDSPPTTVRVCIFKWKPMSDVNVPTGGIIFNYAGTLSPEEIPISFYNHDQMSQFEILYDELITLAPREDVATNTTFPRTGTYATREVTINMKDSLVQFLAAGQDGSGIPYIYAVGSNGDFGFSTGAVRMCFASRINYTDL